jgi:pimeloyl-ACP methyl ester carboxylesterase
MTNIFEPSLQQYTITVEGLTCFAYSYSDMDSEKPLLVVVHGSPGSHKDFNKYLSDKDLQQKYRILALDRPGYGQSIQQGVLSFPSLAFQAKVVRRFTEKFRHQQKVVVLGHSVGGPIVTHYATTHAADIQALVLLAPAISAKDEQPRWYNRMAEKQWVNQNVGQNMRISQTEMMVLPQQLEAMQANLHKITCETWLFHSKMDMIAPYPNALYVKQNFSKATLHFKTYLLKTHFIHFTKYKDIKNILLKEILK